MHRSSLNMLFCWRYIDRRQSRGRGGADEGGGIKGEGGAAGLTALCIQLTGAAPTVTSAARGTLNDSFMGDVLCCC